MSRSAATKLAVLWSHAGKDHHAAPSQQAKQIVNGQIKAQLGQRQYPVFPADRPTLVNSQDGIDRPRSLPLSVYR